MNHLKFSTQIRAPREKVWNVLWNDITYRKWTSVFNEGSYAESDWNEGSKVNFLSPTGDGMYSRIDKKVPNEFMSFKHLGVIKEGKEQPQDEETKKWSGAMEDYRLKEANGLTELIVETDVTEDFQEYMEKTFPMALEKVKDLSEN
jgi:hypothetical protein